MRIPIGAALLALGLGTAGQAEPGQPAPESDERTQEVDPEEVDSIWQYLLERYDCDGDGKISREEYSRSDEHFARLDRDGNSTIEKSDAKRKRRRGDRTRGRERGAVRPKAITPGEGDKAPDFDLEVLVPKKTDKGDSAGKEAKAMTDRKTKDAKIEKVRLSSFQGKKPVALIFGSYT